MVVPGALTLDHLVGRKGKVDEQPWVGMEQEQKAMEATPNPPFPWGDGQKTAKWL